MRTVAEYRPESGIQDLVWLQSQAEQAALATNVTPLRPHLSRKANPPRANIAS
jgi:hypothetical protein